MHCARSVLLSQDYGGNGGYEFYANFTPTYLYFSSLTANTKVAMGKRFFVFAS